MPRVSLLDRCTSELLKAQAEQSGPPALFGGDPQARDTPTLAPSRTLSVVPPPHRIHSLSEQDGLLSLAPHRGGRHSSGTTHRPAGHLTAVPFSRPEPQWPGLLELLQGLYPSCQSEPTAEGEDSSSGRAHTAPIHCKPPANGKHKAALPARLRYQRPAGDRPCDEPASKPIQGTGSGLLAGLSPVTAPVLTGVFDDIQSLQQELNATQLLATAPESPRDRRRRRTGRPWTSVTSPTPPGSRSATQSDVVIHQLNVRAHHRQAVWKRRLAALDSEQQTTAAKRRSAREQEYRDQQLRLKLDLQRRVSLWSSAVLCLRFCIGTRLVATEQQAQLKRRARARACLSFQRFFVPFWKARRLAKRSNAMMGVVKLALHLIRWRKKRFCRLVDVVRHFLVYFASDKLLAARRYFHVAVRTQRTFAKAVAVRRAQLAMLVRWIELVEAWLLQKEISDFADTDAAVDVEAAAAALRAPCAGRPARSLQQRLVCGEAAPLHTARQATAEWRVATQEGLLSCAQARHLSPFRQMCVLRRSNKHAAMLRDRVSRAHAAGRLHQTGPPKGASYYAAAAKYATRDRRVPYHSNTDDAAPSTPRRLSSLSPSDELENDPLPPRLRRMRMTGAMRAQIASDFLGALRKSAHAAYHSELVAHRLTVKLTAASAVRRLPAPVPGFVKVLDATSESDLVRRVRKGLCTISLERKILQSER
ncbi:hypothetical protein DIPPA_29519 [Diplonema papillatum]|nr:hypothetical protein DIPPA_29519 [Diplonema papillatum]